MMLFIIIQLNLEWDENKFNSNQMEDQIGTVLHWSYQKEHKQSKSKDYVIRRKMDRICILATVKPFIPQNTKTAKDGDLIPSLEREG